MFACLAEGGGRAGSRTLAPLEWGEDGQDRALRGLSPPREVAGQGQHPRLPPVPAPPLAPGQLPGAPGLGEEGGGYVLICCEGGALGGLWFGLGLGLFWFFFYWRFS